MVPVPRWPLWALCWGHTGTAGPLGTVSPLPLGNAVGLVCERTGLPDAVAAHLQQGPVLGCGWGGGIWGSAFPGGFSGRCYSQTAPV